MSLKRVTPVDSHLRHRLCLIFQSSSFFAVCFVIVTCVKYNVTYMSGISIHVFITFWSFLCMCVIRSQSVRTQRRKIHQISLKYPKSSERRKHWHILRDENILKTILSIHSPLTCIIVCFWLTQTNMFGMIVTGNIYQQEASLNKNHIMLN